MEKKLQKIYLTYYNLLIVLIFIDLFIEGLSEAHYQIV